MEMVIEVAQAMVWVAVAIFALGIATIATYSIIAGIQSCIEERKEKRGKKK